MRAAWLVLLLLPAAVAASEITAVPPLGSGALDRGIVGVRCTDELGLITTSRASLLELGPALRAEVLLTTAHGLPSDAATARRRCRVLVPGRTLKIADVLHAGGDLRGSPHDWAVVVLEDRIAGAVQRWRPAETAPEWFAKSAAAGAHVRLVLRTGDGGDTDCRLEPPAAPGPLLGHSCIAHPGMSGSPLVAVVDAAVEPVLLAIHIGTEMSWRGTKLDFVRVARPIDAEVAAAIETAARRTTVLASNDNKRRAPPRQR